MSACPSGRLAVCPHPSLIVTPTTDRLDWPPRCTLHAARCTLHAACSRQSLTQVHGLSPSHSVCTHTLRCCGSHNLDRLGCPLLVSLGHTRRRTTNHGRKHYSAKATLTFSPYSSHGLPSAPLACQRHTSLNGAKPSGRYHGATMVWSSPNTSASHHHPSDPKCAMLHRCSSPSTKTMYPSPGPAASPWIHVQARHAPWPPACPITPRPSSTSSLSPRRALMRPRPRYVCT